MNLQQLIQAIETQVLNPKLSLPYEVFLFITRMTPMVNVDLLIQNEAGETLLSWRDDQFGAKGWHIPGGIVRYKETFESRIHMVAKTELNTKVDFVLEPLALNQIVVEQASRGHFISLLYSCSVPDDYQIENRERMKHDPGFLQWHKKCPDDLISVHHIYKKFFEPGSGELNHE